MSTTRSELPSLSRRLQEASQFLYRPVVYHTFFWGCYIALMLLFRGSDNWLIALISVLIHTIFLAAIVYTNLFYLIPKFLNKKRIFLYLITLVIVTLLLTPIEIFFLYLNLSDYPNAQIQLLNNQFSQFVFLLVVVGVNTVATITKEWWVQKRIQQDLEKRTLQSELSLLKSQINPHFLFNTLNSLYALTLKKSDKSPEIVLRLSEMMRYMLYECNTRIVPLEKEIQYIKNYIELERIRYGNVARIEFDYGGDDVENYKVIPLLFITFLENAFKHGLSHHIDGGYVEAMLYVEDGMLDFTLQNSISEQQDELYYQGGIGLKNISRRLELIYGKKNYELHIEAEEKIYTVSLRLDLNAPIYYPEN